MCVCVCVCVCVSVSFIQFANSSAFDNSINKLMLCLMKPYKHKFSTLIKPY